MVMDVVPGLEYHVVLNKCIDYFDIVPHIEKLARCRLYIEDAGRGKSRLIIAGVYDTHKRVLDSNKYKSLGAYNWMGTDGIIEDKTPIDMTDSEKRLLDEVLKYVQPEDVDHHSWYIITRSC